jgi:hypothetical protein
MITSRGDYARSVEALTSSNGTAAYTSNTLNLVDCIPSTACALTWTSGAQSSSVWVQLPWRMTPAPTIECRVFALLGLVGIPAGVRVELYSGASIGALTQRSATEVVRLPNGTYGAWIVRDEGEGWTHEYWAWRIYNDDGDTSPIAASANLLVGELYASPAWQWDVGRWDTKVVMPHIINRANSGAARKVKRDSYRTVDLTITPQDWQTAMAGEDTLLDMLYDLAQQDCVAIVPRPENRGDAGVNADVVPRTAMLADLTDAGGLAADAASDHYPLNLSFEEFL